MGYYLANGRAICHNWCRSLKETPLALPSRSQGLAGRNLFQLEAANLIKGWSNSGKRQTDWGTCQMQSLKIKVGLNWPLPIIHFWPYGCLLEPKVEETQAAVHWKLGLGVPPTSPQAFVTRESRAVPRSPTIHPYSITPSPSVSQETTHPSLQL